MSIKIQIVVLTFLAVSIGAFVLLRNGLPPVPLVKKASYMHLADSSVALAKGCPIKLPASATDISYWMVSSLMISRQIALFAIDQSEADMYIKTLFEKYVAKQSSTILDCAKDFEDQEIKAWLISHEMVRGPIPGTQYSWSGADGDAYLGVFLSENKQFVLVVRNN